MISKWKANFLAKLSVTFKRSEMTDNQDKDTSKMYATIDHLKLENEFLKKLQEVGHRDLRAQLLQSHTSKIFISK